MVTQGALYSVNQAMSKSLQKLSTGLRINSASDDAAGLGVSENLRTQVNGLSQATSNTQDAITLLNIADGALNEQSDILQRMRQLTIQAKNDTYTSTERAYMGSEFDALFHELDRIAEVTNFNKMQIFATPENQNQGTIFAGNTVYPANNLNASPHELADERTIFTNQNDAFGGGTDYASSNHFNFMVGANYNAQDAANFNAASDAYNPGAGDMITVQFTQMDTNALFCPAPDMVEAASFLETPTANGVNPFGWDPTQAGSGDQAITQAITDHTATIQDKLSMILDMIDGNPLDPQIEAAYFQGGGGNGTNLTGLKRVNTMRADIGAMINRFQDAVSNDQAGTTNQQAAESQNPGR